MSLIGVATKNVSPTGSLEPRESFRLNPLHRKVFDSTVKELLQSARDVQEVRVNLLMPIVWHRKRGGAVINGASVDTSRRKGMHELSGCLGAAVAAATCATPKELKNYYCTPFGMHLDSSRSFRSCKRAWCTSCYHRRMNVATARFNATVGSAPFVAMTLQSRHPFTSRLYGFMPGNTRTMSDDLHAYVRGKVGHDAPVCRTFGFQCQNSHPQLVVTSLFLYADQQQAQAAVNAISHLSPVQLDYNFTVGIASDVSTAMTTLFDADNIRLCGAAAPKLHDPASLRMLAAVYDEEQGFKNKKSVLMLGDWKE